MSKYVDGFVFVVPRDKVSEYKKMAEDGARMWKENGALDYMECMGEDLTPKSMEGMKPLSFVEMTKASSNETVWFSFIVFKSKEHRDEVNAKVMKQMEKAYPDQKGMTMPFEMNRMAYGGFEVEVEG